MPNEPTITSKNLPKPPVPGIPGQVAPTQATASPPVVGGVDAPLSYEQIIAKPLRAPNFINLKPKNPNLCLYWGNRSVGEKESGMRYDQLIAMGFQPARPDEVLGLSVKSEPIPLPASLVRDGRIMYGDLILLKIPRSDYIGALKWNEQSARARVRKPGTTLEGSGSERQQADGREQPVDAFRSVVGNPELAKKIRPYVPPLAEVDALTKNNT